MNFYWIPWIAGMLIPFGFKLGHHLFVTAPGGTKTEYVKAIASFVFGDAAASTTTVVTFSTELLIGSWYIDGLPVPYMQSINIPQHWAVCFFLALISEGIAPIIVKSIYGWAEARIKKILE